MVAAKLTSLLEARGYDCFTAPILRNEDAAYKPDMLATKDGISWIIDIATPYETNDSLARKHMKKCRKFANLAPVLKPLTGATNFATGALEFQLHQLAVVQASSQPAEVFFRCGLVSKRGMVVYLVGKTFA
ncbi:hypothetical protein M514_11245 [Trichuris suis]|uniref:Uncharacterized protein n=1 Tax=Trichuris suis TaxID=68888 RepID=A0A085N575_9BILA|nr:hypothetical protein M513_11245 [Trichuris suis]KFD64621.1 hypothetical protein M514_11245 [Trichuris suis]